jgi:hypothetical protein
MSRREEETTPGHHEPWFPQYSFLTQVAGEARALRERYWQAGGENDRRYPVQSNPGWYKKKEATK